ncbi:MAG: polysaccharide deacetylase family protein [Bryobacteraceae bacterium]|jgi:peptidoglycan/xylan/chitin deacetylase (PgdA/CDA1 family)
MAFPLRNSRKTECGAIRTLSGLEVRAAPFALKRAALRLFHSAGGLSAVRFRYRHGLRILMYHRFPGGESALEKQLARQCIHLKENYRVLSMREASKLLVNRDPFPLNAVVLTVDDGHRDFYTGAYPVFQRYGLPVTVYVTTDYLDGRCWLWFDLIDFLFEHTKQALPGMEDAEACKQAALRMTHEDRIKLIEQLPGLLKVDLPDFLPEEWAPVTWDEVREMASHGIEFGAHTRTHPILSKLAGPNDVLDEIEGSKHRVEEELNTEVLHFCYPNGSRADFAGVIEQVRQAGFRTAVTSEPGVNRLDTSPYELKRIGAEPGLDPQYFERRVAGVRVV